MKMMADPKELMKETTICIVSDTIFPDLTKCEQDLSKLPTAQPNVVAKGNDYFISLWQKEVGQLSNLMSVTIKEISKLKMATLKITFSQNETKNAIVIKAYIVAKLLYAETIKTFVTSIFGDQLATYVTIPPDVFTHLQTKNKTSNSNVVERIQPIGISGMTPISDLLKRRYTENGSNIDPNQIPKLQTSTNTMSFPSKVPKLVSIQNLQEALMSINNKITNQNSTLTSSNSTVLSKAGTSGSMIISFPSLNTGPITNTTSSLKTPNYTSNNSGNILQRINGMNTSISLQVPSASSVVNSFKKTSANISNTRVLMNTATATIQKQAINSLLPSSATTSLSKNAATSSALIYRNGTTSTITNPLFSTVSPTSTSPSGIIMENIKIKQEKEDLSVKKLNDLNSMTPIITTTQVTTTVMKTMTVETPSSSTPCATNTLSLSTSATTVVPKKEPEFNNISGIYSSNSTIDGEPTVLSDLPPNILEKLNVFNRDQTNIQRENRISNLLDGRNICGFLLSKEVITVSSENQSQYFNTPEESQTAASSTSNFNGDMGSNGGHDGNEGSSDEDNSIGFSSSFLQRRRSKKRADPTSHIGANTDELYEDPADVARRNWGHETEGVDSADTMFSSVPPPVIQKNELDEIFDLMSEFPKDQEREPCDAILRKLLLHQRMALHWMINRENTAELPPFWECIKLNRDYFNTATRKRLYERPLSIKGGILADDMGLGKTLTTIALILTNHKNEKPMFDNKKGLPTKASEIAAGDSKITIKRRKDGYKSTTKAEYSKPGFQFRQIYLQQVGKKKKSKKSKKQKEKEKTRTAMSNAMFSSDSETEDKDAKHVNKAVKSVLNSTVISDSGSSSGKSKKTGLFGQQPTDRKMTLIVCPMSVLSNWTDQFQEHVSPTINLQIYEYYGPNRVRDLSFLLKHDIILSTYGTVSGDYRLSVVKDKLSPLHKINWLRIILDEGHVIRNSRSQTTTAMMNLNAERRWLLTGTPIQNRMTDLWSMVKFLRLEPFTNRKWWFEYVVSSMKRQAAPGQLVYNRVQKLIKHMAIRRCKTDRINGRPIVNLPSRKVVIQKVKFNEDERKLYDAMHKDGKLVVCKYIRMGTVLKNYANVLVIIMRLRQLCCHPNLCINAVKRLQKALRVMNQLQDNINQTENGDDDDNTNNTELNDGEREKLIQQLMQLLTSGDSEECSICLEILQDPVITKCAHVFCSNCITEVIEGAHAPVCPLCRADIDQASMVKVPESSKAQEEEEENSALKKDVTDDDYDDGQPWISSSKVDAMMITLRAQRDSDSTIKTLVVSQFTSYLDVLQKPLRREGFSFVRLDGKMSQAARARVIDEFQKEDDFSPMIMLLSLTAGGVGLNLTAASRVFLLDPAWNPAVEEQCFDRAHRLGQKKNVLVIKFVVENTVEDRMLILQNQKRELMEKAFGIRQQSQEERQAATLRDIATLLNIDIPAPNPALR